jgi:molecular chaperone GrpE (heat shock protein)
MAELTPEQIVANELAATKLAETQATELKATNKKEALRELSKELGINAFEPEELKNKFNEFTTWQESQKTEQDKLQEQVDSYKTKETEWIAKELDFNSKLQASELGISLDNLEDALKLAGGDPSKLVDVIKKYPVFKSQKGIKIGENGQQESATGGLTDAEKYGKKWKDSSYYNPTD